VEKIKIALQKTAKSINEEFKEADWKEFKPRVLARLEPVMENREEIFFWEIDDAVIDSLLRSRFKEIAKEYIQSRSRIRKDKLNDLGLSPVAMQLLKERYLKKDDKEEPIETAKEMMCRIATAISSVEKQQKLKEEYSEKFTNMLCNLEFLPNSPCIFNAGTGRRGTLAACFGYTIEDSLDSIFETLKLSAKTFQMGGGVGINISKLREAGCSIKSSHGTSSGPIAFLYLFDTMVETVKSGGARRGAMLSMMHYTHPDIEKFIDCKNQTNQLNNMNVSVLLDDKFIKAVDKDELIVLKSPKTGKEINAIPARQLLESIAIHIYNTGEPGVLFDENINKDNPTPHLGPLDVINPCGESPMRGTPGESCNLGSINLTKFVRDKDVDWDRLSEITKLAVRFLDNMIDASAYPSKIVEQSVKDTRKIGLGIMGFADLLIMMDIKYSSKQAIEMAGKITSFISDVASQYSTELGKEKGTYLAYKEGYKNRRNSVCCIVAPTGTLSLLAGCSSGIEPNFSKEYTRILGNEIVKIAHPLKDNSSFEMTYDVPVEQHLAIQAEVQKNIEGAISKTINAPENITVREIKELIIKAHKLGIKGFTLFRQNCSREALIKGCTECQI